MVCNSGSAIVSKYEQIFLKEKEDDDDERRRNTLFIFTFKSNLHVKGKSSLTRLNNVAHISV